jgi:hypothetical protein
VTDDRESLAHLLGDYDSPDQIAERFTEAGVKAIPGDPCECAVARYVQLYDFAKVHITCDNDGDYLVEADDEIFWVQSDEPMAAFIHAFDARSYPQLIAVEAAA